MPKKRKPLSKFLEKYYDLINNTDEEQIWKPVMIGDYPLYEISNHGLLRRIDTKATINPFHSYRKDKDGNFILDRPTYLRVQVYYYENGVRKKAHMEISRLVAAAFIPIPKKYIKLGYTMDTLQVNHIRGGYEIYNNFVSNLEWCTNEENIDKAFETGLRNPVYGEKHHSTWLKLSDVIIICECIRDGINAKDTYNKLNPNVSFDKFKPCYYNIKYKDSWVYVSDNYF